MQLSNSPQTSTENTQSGFEKLHRISQLFTPDMTPENAWKLAEQLREDGDLHLKVEQNGATEYIYFVPGLDRPDFQSCVLAVDVNREGEIASYGYYNFDLAGIMSAPTIQMGQGETVTRIITALAANN